MFFWIEQFFGVWDICTRILNLLREFGAWIDYWAEFIQLGDTRPVKYDKHFQS